MNTLVIDCGSLSLKYQLIDSASEVVLTKGLCGRIGIEGGQIAYQPTRREREVAVSPISTHTQATQMVLGALISDKAGMIKDLDEVGVVGHRIVHGGEVLTAFTPITEDTIKTIKEYSDLAPLHNPANPIGIRAYQELMPSTLTVGVFDATFHQTMSKKVYLYGLPYEYYKKYKVRRYGLYGTSHSYVPKRTAEILGCPYDSLKTMVCHLDSDSSILTVLDRKSMDTSMGLTPLGELVIGTRSDDVDPDALRLIMRKENMDIDQMLDVLNKKSGVYGTSGVSSDFRDVESTVSEGNKRVETAPESFAYRVTKYVGACAAAISGVDTTAFIAGVGENDRIARKKIYGYPAFLEIEIDDEANSKRGQEIVISVPDSEASVLVIPTNEGLAVVRETLALVK